MNTPVQAGWLTRIAVTLTTVALLILGFFFFTVALIAGAILAIIVGARLWWTLRKLKRAQPAVHGDHATRDVVEGEYQVVERERVAVRLPPQP